MVFGEICWNVLNREFIYSILNGRRLHDLEEICRNVLSGDFIWLVTVVIGFARCANNVASKATRIAAFRAAVGKFTRHASQPVLFF